MEKGSKFKRQSQVYVVEIDDRAVAAFEAISGREARELNNEAWLKDDLAKLASNGSPLWTTDSLMTIRAATANEMSLFWQAEKKVVPDGELTLAYLVDLDLA